jgi:hypothetical protein
MSQFGKAVAYVKENWVSIASALLGGLLLVVVLWWWTKPAASTLANPNAIHRYVVGLDGSSLDDRINAAAALNKHSGLTGTRDVPVFFQEFNSELVRDDDGNLNRAVTEGLAGTKDAIDDLERKMMLA